MILVIEGANKVGKSTIIKNLKQVYGEENVVNVYERQEADEILQHGRKIFKYVNYAVGMSNIRYLEIMNKMHPEKIFVLDRFHLTELVYGELKRRYNAYDTFKELDKHLFDLDARLLLMLSNFSHVDDIDEVAKLDCLQNRMLDAFELSKLRKQSWLFYSEFELASAGVLTDIIENFNY